MKRILRVEEVECQGDVDTSLNTFYSRQQQNLYLCKNLYLKEKSKYWLDLSDYDFETAEAMLAGGRFLYVGFMCHQTIEKILKAYFCSKSEETSPYSHNLSYLVGKSGLSNIIPENFKEFINLLEPLNIEARYPTHKEQLMKSLTKIRCEEILIKTKELQSWVKERL